MNKQEAIDKIKSKKISNNCLSNYGLGYNEALDMSICIIDQLEEPVKPPEQKPLEQEKPVVPKFVADWYEANKYDFEYSLYKLCIDFNKRVLQDDLQEWFGPDDNKAIETLVKMKLYGYEVEKEKLYTVELPNNGGYYHIVLVRNAIGEIKLINTENIIWKESDYAQLTEAEIKQDFDWAWQFAKEVEE